LAFGFRKRLLAGFPNFFPVFAVNAFAKSLYERFSLAIAAQEVAQPTLQDKLSVIYCLRSAVQCS